MAADQISRDVRLYGLEAHPVARRIMQGERDKVYLHHAGQTPGQIPKQFVHVAVCGNGFGNLEERLIPLSQSLTG
jgi:hypothetical protein